MGALTEATLLLTCNKILQELEESTTADVSTVTSGMPFRVLNTIDNVLQEIHAAYPFDFMQHEDTSISTTSGTPAYAVPESVYAHQIKALKLLNHATPGSATTDTWLEWMEYDLYAKWVEQRPSTGQSSTGKPYKYTLYDQKIWLFPTPDTNDGDGYSLLIQGTQLFDILTRANSTTLNLPVHFEHCLQYGALAQLLERTDMMRAQSYSARYFRALNKLIGTAQASEDLRFRV